MPTYVMNPSLVRPFRLWAVVFVIAATVAVVAYGCAQPEPTSTPVPTATPTPPATPIPEVSFSMSADSVMAPLDVGFSVDSPSADATYTWEFGDGGTSSGEATSHAYLDAGQFVAILRADFGTEVKTAERSVNVQPGPAGWVVLNQESVSLESGDSFDFDAEAFDELGNPVGTEAVVWSTDPAAGSIGSDGVFTAGEAVGSWDAGVVATFDRGGVTVTTEIPVKIVYGTPTSIVIEPSEIETRVTWGFELTARVLDEAGNELPDVDVQWEVLRPGDSVSPTGEYIPSTVVAALGSALVVARVDVNDTQLSSVVRGSVSPGILDVVRIAPDGLGALKPTESVDLSAAGYDRFGNEVELDSVRWVLEDDAIGTVTAGGRLTVGTKAGAFGDEALAVRGFKDGVESVTYSSIEVLPDVATSMAFVAPDDTVPAGAASPLELDVRDRFGNRVDDAAVEIEVHGGGYLAEPNIFVAGLDAGVHVDAVTATLSGMNTSTGAAIEAKTSVIVRPRSSDFLAIDVEGNQGSTVYLINLVTAQMSPASRTFETDGGGEGMPAWMPDGNRLLLTASVSGSNQIYIVDPFHDISHRMTEVSGGALMAAPSPEGDQLAFVRSGNAQSGWDIVLAQMRFDETGAPVSTIEDDDLTILSSDSTSRNILPSWSPDGQWLMYTALDSQNRANVLIVNVANPLGDTGFEVRNASGLAWHPSGDEVLITSTRLVPSGRIASVPLMLSLITGDTRELDVGGLGVAIASFSPDGSELAFVDEDTGVLWLMDSDGTGRRQAVGAQFQTTITSWRPRDLELPTRVDQYHVYPGETISREDVSSALEGDTPTVQIVTDAGTLTAVLLPAVAPRAVANFVYLAVNGYYDGLGFHTVDAGAAYSGSITGGPGGTAGYYLPSELNPGALHDRAGVLSMVAGRAGAVSSEFVVSLEPHPEWDGFVGAEPKDCDTFGSQCYVVFGRVIEGLDAVREWDRVNPFDALSEPHFILDVIVTLADGTVLGSDR